MRYKVVYKFKWLLILAFLALIYLSNLIYLELPFTSLYFPKKQTEMGFFIFLLSLFPRLHFESQIYNLQTVTSWLCGAVCGARIGLITLSTYLILGLIGLPVFAGGGGLSYIKEPTFGYLLSLPFNSYLSGYLYNKDKKILAVFLPMLTTHLFGIIYLLFFRQDLLDISWHLSFSMIGYDLIFALLLMTIVPMISFVMKEMIAQEIPVRTTIEDVAPTLTRRKTRYKN